MSELKHTPGAWEYGRAIPPHEQPLFDVSAKRSSCWLALIGNSCTSKEEAEANARLIAAAPDMLAALELAHQTYENLTTAQFETGGDLAARKAIAAAIAQAKGLQPESK